MTRALSSAEQEIHVAAHRWSSIAVLLLSVLAVAPMWAPFRALLRVEPLDTIPTLGTCALLMGGVHIAFRSEHLARRWYRWVDIAETLAGQAAFLYLTYISRNAFSFFLPLHFGHVFFISTSPNPRRINAAIIGMGPTAVGVAFILRGDADSGFFCLWVAAVGVLELWILETLKKRLIRHMEKVKQTEAALAKANLELERQRIARDLHDGVGSELAALLWQMRQLDLELAGEMPHERVSGLVEHAHRSLVELRSVVWAMRAPARTWPETVERLRQFLARLCASRVALELSASRSAGEVPGNVCLHLERFVQEAAQNALKHARASRLRVELTFGPTLRASVEDDGVGLPEGVAAISEGGLRNLRTRLESVGGELAIEACSPGTRLSASFPLASARESKAA